MSLTGIIAAVLAFGILVVIHELGHFLAAKWMGVRVEKFSIGFPPTLFSKKIGETEFSISAIPLGGFVKMAGFIDESMDDNITGAEDEYNSKPVWKRMVIITAGVIMNLLLAIGIYTYINYENGMFIEPTTTVLVPEQSVMAKRIGFKTGDKILSLNGIDVTDWRSVFTTFFNEMENGVTFNITREGNEIQLFYKAEWLSEKNGELLDIAPFVSSKLGDIVAGSPAEKAGLQKGDIITLLAGKAINSWQEMTSIIRKNPENTLAVSYQRSGIEYMTELTPKLVSITLENGADSSFGQMGTTSFYIHKKLSFFEALKMGTVQPFEMIYMNYMGLKWMITGVKPAKDTVGGPVMIARLVDEAAQRGWTQYLSLIAMLSAVLAFFNMLPIPALDGGHFLFLVIEGIMGKPLSLKTRMAVQQFGMAFLLLFIIYVFYIDVIRIFS